MERLSTELHLPSGLIYDVVKKILHRGAGGGSRLSDREFHCLTVLMAHPTGISRVAFFQEVWETQKEPTATLDVYVSALREKLRPLDLEIRWDSGLFFLVLTIPS